MALLQFRRVYWVGLLGPLLIPAPGFGQSAPPVVVQGGGLPMAAAHGHEVGPLKAKLQRANYAFHNKFAGWPENFVEPPLGTSVYATFTQATAKADPHRYLLYQSDFVGNSTTLSPSGAQRLSLIAARIQCDPGRPLTVEWTPTNPTLADSRRQAVESLCQRSGLTLMAGQVRVGPSPYPGLPGAEAANNNDTLIQRNADAARSFSRTPVPQATLIGSGGP